MSKFPIKIQIIPHSVGMALVSPVFVVVVAAQNISPKILSNIDEFTVNSLRSVKKAECMPIT